MQNKSLTKQRVFIIFAILAGLTIAFSQFAGHLKTEASGTYTGTVYVDYNMNGARNTSAAAPNYAIDAGLGGVTVTLYDAGGTARGTAVTCTALNNPTAFCTGSNNGAYSIASSGSGPYRVEFTNLPSGYSPSFFGTNNATTVRFVADGGVSNVDLGVIEPSEYCQTNPLVVTNTYVVGAGTFDTLIRYPYNYSDELDGRLNSVDATSWTSPPSRLSNLNPTGIATVDPVGSTFGLSWNNLNDRLYASAYLKRGARFGTLSGESTGAIYTMTGATTASPSTSLFVDLNVAFTGTPAGANPHPAGSTGDWTVDTATIPLIGKRGLGGMKLSKDGANLYVVNLGDRRLYVIPTSGALNSTTITRFDIPTSGLATSSGNCVTTDVRPFAVGRDRSGQIYVGAVCSAESESADIKVHAYVWRFDGAAFTLVANRSLNFPRNAASSESATWERWANVTGVISNPTPMLSDIEFDGANMIIAMRDRYGDQAVTPDFYRGYGDLMRACPNGSNFDFENNGSCGGVTAGGAGTNEGPGGGEYYADLNGDSREEGGLGGLFQVPGFNHVISTYYDPVSYNSAGTRVGNFYTSGIQRYSNTTGVMVGAYDIYLEADTGNFGKANGNGDAEVLCSAAPLQIGNRVWLDTNGNGVQDANENGITNVTVRLYNSANALLATAVTDASGNYYFSSASGTNTTSAIYGLNILPNANYQVRLDLAANYSGAGALTGLLMTTRDQTSQAGDDDASDSDASLVINPTNSPSGTFPVINVSTGANGNNNHTLDIGFTSSATYSIGNRVWFDTDNDGQIDAAEVGINGVSVSLFLDANADGTPDTPGTPVGAAQTTSGGGYYRFDSLAANSYVVRINASNFANGAVLGGYANTAGSNNSDTDSSSVAGQNGENGINPGGAANSIQTNGLLSGSITLGAPGEPVSEADVQAGGQGSMDAAANMTVDFGFYRACISGIVWNDNGAGANNNNGILNSGESPIPFVRVQIYNSSNAEVLVGFDGILGTSDDGVNGMLTNSSGNYSLCGLPPGQYRVVVTPSGGTSSTPTSNNPDDNIDSDDNGFTGTAPFVGRIVSGLVTVTPGSTGVLGNKTVTNSTGTTSDPTIDFGFVLPPTAIQLQDFTVTTDGDAVSLKWSTGGEAGNLGFNIYRETNGERELVNSAPIAGSALRSSANLQASGDNYGWVDKAAKLNSVYYLEDIDIEGTRTLYGPVAPMFRVSLNKFEQNPLLLSDLATVANPSMQKEFVGERPESANSALNPSRQFEIASKAGVKISVNHDGWYRVSAEQLQANGFDTNSNRVNWQMFVGGEEIAMKIRNDGSIEFFGRGADTASTDRQVYYLINGQAAGLRLTEVRSGRAGENPLASYAVTVGRKDRSIYVSSLLNGEAENWFGAIINRNSQTVQSLSLNNIDANGAARLRVRLQGLTAGEHFVSVKFNDTDLGQISYNNQENREFEFDVPAASLIEGANSIKLQSLGSASDVSLVDAVSVSYSRRYKAVNNQLRFNVPAGQSVKVGGFSTGKIAVNQIKNGEVGVRVAAFVEEANGEFSFELSATGSNREFLAAALVQAEVPAAVERNIPSGWNDSANTADFVIIAPAIFQNQAQSLAQMRQAQGLNSKVVLAEDVADEYGYGVLTAEAVKLFLQNASANWNVKPRYAVLLGDSSYDLRNYLGQANRNLVPTRLIDTMFMETSSDSWLADFDNDGIENIAVGRLPAATTAEADALISKLVRYDNQSTRTVKSGVLTADRGFESYSQTLQNNLPNDVNAIRIDRSVMTDAEMHSEVMSKLNDNPMVAVYTGHGSTGVWANSAVFSVADAASLTNSQLGFYMLTTCLNGYTHNAYNDSLAEVALKNGQGGAIAVWASSSTSFADPQAEISRTAVGLIFNGQLRIGDIVRQAKQTTADREVRQTYLLLGDPTVVIK